MALLDSFLRLVVELKASDLHFTSGATPLVRHDGEMVPLPYRVLTEGEARRMLLEILAPEQQAQFEKEGELDFVYAVEGLGRFRGNLFRHSRGLGASIRVIANRLHTLEELGLPAVLARLTQTSHGLVLVTGATGSGKTTTLSAMVHEINRSSPRHIITIEDPIEVVHPRLQSLITQRQVGEHTDSFASALRSALRESPDVLVVGEMRDLETISLALSAAETGVLVIGTLHTRSAAKAVDRILDAVPEESRDQVRGVLSVLLKGVVAQQLVRRADGHGRVAALEVLLSNFAVAHMIRENKVHQLEAYLQTADAASGMLSLDASLHALVRDGVVTLEEAASVANHPEELRRLCTPQAAPLAVAG